MIARYGFRSLTDNSSLASDLWLARSVTHSLTHKPAPSPLSQLFKFCRSKCHKNFVKKRNPRKTAWTKSFRKARGKEMSVDATFDFEKRRNRPVKYDRELMGTTLRAMQRVGEIKARREKMYFEKRMKDAAKTQIKQSKVELKQGIELLVPAAANKEKVLLNVVETQKVKTSAKNQSAVRQKAAKAAAMDE